MPIRSAASDLIFSKIVGYWYRGVRHSRSTTGGLMSTYRLDKVFAPHSVAVVGASPRDRSAHQGLKIVAAENSRRIKRVRGHLVDDALSICFARRRARNILKV